jgi:hypothetical protein
MVLVEVVVEGLNRGCNQVVDFHETLFALGTDIFRGLSVHSRNRQFAIGHDFLGQNFARIYRGNSNQIVLICIQ